MRGHLNTSAAGKRARIIAREKRRNPLGALRNNNNNVRVVCLCARRRYVVVTCTPPFCSKKYLRILHAAVIRKMIFVNPNTNKIHSFNEVYTRLVHSTHWFGEIQHSSAYVDRSQNNIYLFRREVVLWCCERDPDLVFVVMTFWSFKHILRYYHYVIDSPLIQSQWKCCVKNSKQKV